jgi:hypothetical protein
MGPTLTWEAIHELEAKLDRLHDEIEMDMLWTNAKPRQGPAIRIAKEVAMATVAPGNVFRKGQPRHAVGRRRAEK